MAIPINPMNLQNQTQGGAGGAVGGGVTPTPGGAPQYQPIVPRTQRPGQNAPISTATGPGVRPGVVSGGVPAGMREVFSYDANGNRMRRLVPIDQPAQGGAQTPTSGTGGTGPVVGGGPTGGGTGGTGGNPATGGAGNPSQGPIDPVDVVNGRPTLDSFQQYQDAAMQQARRQLDPVWEANQRQFEQTMINKGLSPGTAAYDRALDQFNRGKNDQYNAAQNMALQQGLGAQQQAWGQNYQESALANALLRAREQNATTLNVANTNAGASLSSADIGRQNFLDQLGFNQSQAAVASDQWNRQFGQSQQQWADQFGQSQAAQDFAQMMGMAGFDRDTTWGNNTQQNQQFQQLASLFGALQPQAQGTNPVDYLGALGMNQAGQQQNYQAGVGQANQQNASYMALLASLFCDEEAKTVTGAPDPARCLEIAEQIPLASFTYNGDPSKTEFVGTMAQPFNRMLHGSPVPYIRTMDIVGVLLGAVKHLADRVHTLEGQNHGLA